MVGLNTFLTKAEAYKREQRRQRREAFNAKNQFVAIEDTTIDGHCQCGSLTVDIFIFDDYNEHYCSYDCLMKYGIFEGEEPK